MFFAIQMKGFGRSSHLSDKIIKAVALQFIRNYKMSSNEILLDKVIRSKYKVSLKTACLNLILNSKIYSSNSADEIIVTFIERKHKDLATLITYGNGLVYGSQILYKAFGKL